MRSTWSCMFLVGLVALCSCGEPEIRTIYKDHPVEFEDRAVLEEQLGDPELLLGVFEEQLFRTIEEGDDVAIIQGFQGGTWVHLSIQVKALPADGLIEASLGDLGEIRYGLKLARTPEGFLEAYDIPIPVRRTEEELLDIYGRDYQLEVTFKSGGKEVSQSINVVLVEG